MTASSQGRRQAAREWPARSWAERCALQNADSARRRVYSLRNRAGEQWARDARPSRQCLRLAEEDSMRMQRTRILGAGLSIAALCFVSLLAAPLVRAQAPPRYKVDPYWPKEYPDNWILSNVHGIFVDSSDHVWVLTDPGALAANEIGAAQTPPHAECCIPSPSVMVLDTSGSVIKSWGHPGFTPDDWPSAEHGLWVDREGNVWIGGNAVGAGARGPLDRQVLKLSNEGKLLLQIGHATKDPQNNQDTSILGGPGEMTVDEAAHELYIADGFLNKRVVVYDSNTGAFKRGWGAYGIPLSQIDNSKAAPYNPATPAKQFLGPVACVRISVDGLVYVCDRTSDRIQVFTKEGKFLKESSRCILETLDRGSAWRAWPSRTTRGKIICW